jgi:hypothetical protein
MSRRIVARWQDWSGKNIEHLVVREDPDGIVADAAILATIDDDVLRLGTGSSAIDHGR